MKDGFNTFLDFNKGLTNISYTMDMSKEQLSSLGSSAVDMAVPFVAASATYSPGPAGMANATASASNNDSNFSF